MRNISSAALTAISEQFGSEPVYIVEIQWADGNSLTAYADKDVDGIKGRILDVSDLDSVVNVSGGSDTQQINVKLDDSDGSIKRIFNNNDVHKRPVWVYQWFSGLDLSEKFLLFRGQINSPVEWDEKERTFSCNIVTKIEDKEVGFSAEEGQFSQIPDAMIGRPWPMAFGTVLDLPALRMAKSITGTTQQGVGILSGKKAHAEYVSVTSDMNLIQLGMQLARMEPQHTVLLQAAHDWNVNGGGTAQAALISDQLLAQANDIDVQMRLMIGQYEESLEQERRQKSCQVEKLEQDGVEGPSSIQVLGGEDFPQGVPVEVDINGGLFTGIFNCQTFTILKRRHPDQEEISEQEAARGGVNECNTQQPQTIPAQQFDVSAQGPTELHRQHGIWLGAQFPATENAPNNIMQHFWAEAGSTVRLVSDRAETHIVSIVPGTVLAVKAMKQFEGTQKLVNVPNNLWTQVNENFGPVSAVTVRLSRQLSSIPDQGWADDLYVTFQSSVGPNTVNIMEYLIGQYSDLQADISSFDAVRTALTAFPSNFALFERPQILDLLRDIAFQARCAIFVKNETVFLKYLPAEPDADETITESDIAFDTVQVSLTPTEDLVTKMDITWRPTYAPDDERKIILRHNVAKYGDQADEFDWFIYNQPEIIRKAATFWLIRKSNTWKKLKFKTYLNKLRLETFDTILLDLNTNLVATDDVKAIVEEAVYDSSDNTIEFECLVPVKAGQMTPYKYFWPQVVAGTFPLPSDFPGGDGIGAGASGNLPVSSLNIPSLCSGRIFVGGPNIVWGGPADIGDPKPSDVGFEAQPTIFEDTDFNVEVTPRPRPDLSLPRTRPIDYQRFDPQPLGTVINLHETPIVDLSQGAPRFSTLASIMREVDVDGRLVFDAGAMIGDGVETAEFNFRYDVDGGKFGAGTAFLFDDSEG